MNKLQGLICHKTQPTNQPIRSPELFLVLKPMLIMLWLVESRSFL